MKITKRKLRRIIQEVTVGDSFAIGSADPRGTDHLFPDDPEHPLNKRDELATQIRHASKDIFGTKDHYDLRGKSIEELEDILYDLANSQEQQYMDDESQREMEDEMGRDQELSRAEMAPRRQGMSRRPAGSKSQRRMESVMRISRNKLRQIVKEAVEHADYNVQGAIDRAVDRGHSDAEIQHVLDSSDRDEEIIMMLDRLGSEAYPAPSEEKE